MPEASLFTASEHEARRETGSSIELVGVAEHVKLVHESKANLKIKV